MPSDYVDPCTPPCPSISLVHAFRDKELVSVPCNLLVRGDVVVLGPGHSAPAQVQQVDEISLPVCPEMHIIRQLLVLVNATKCLSVNHLFINVHLAFVFWSFFFRLGLRLLFLSPLGVEDT